MTDKLNQLPPCSPEVFEHGESIGLFDIPKEVAESICLGISAATGARVDWHYFGGRVHIKALPAQPAVEAAEIEVVGYHCRDSDDKATLQWLPHDRSTPLMTVAQHRRILAGVNQQAGSGVPIAEVWARQERTGIRAEIVLLDTSAFPLDRSVKLYAAPLPPSPAAKAGD